MSDDKQQSSPVAPAGHEKAAEVLARRSGSFGASSQDTSGYGGLQTTIYAPSPAKRPFGSYFDDIVDVLGEVLGENGVPPTAVEKIVVDRGELVLHVASAHLVDVARGLRDDQDLRFEMCMGLNGVHFPDHAGRELHVVYYLLSVTHNRRVRLEVSVSEKDPHVPSLVSLYPSADWHEREAWDMFGIIFDGHPALTRILMPDDWPGHPQRKDYPLGGIPVEYKGASIPPPDTRRSYR